MNQNLSHMHWMHHHMHHPHVHAIHLHPVHWLAAHPTLPALLTAGLIAAMVFFLIKMINTGIYLDMLDAGLRGSIWRL